jgi:hypothetical protein
MRKNSPSTARQSFLGIQLSPPYDVLVMGKKLVEQ